MSDSSAPLARTRLVVEWLYYLTAIFFVVTLVVYYCTSEGGPVLLALTLVPVTFILHPLEALRQD